MPEIQFDQTTANEQLVEAEKELYAWATRQRSNINILMQVEANSFEGRQQTIAICEAADADSTRLARERVLALRMLCGLTPEGLDPSQPTPATMASGIVR
jgi:hypothetical protein